MKDIVNIKGRNYKVIKTTQDILVKDEKSDGACDFLNKEIYIKINNNTEYMLQTIIHELIVCNIYSVLLFIFM